MSTEETAQEVSGHRPGTRPPLPPGHTLTMSHGARAPRVYGEVAERLAAGLLEDRPDLAAYPEAVAGWATAEAQAQLMRRHLAEVGSIDPESGEPRGSALNHLRWFEASAAKHRQTLGLDPRSEAELARERAAAVTLGVNLENLAERGRAALSASEGNGRPALHDDLAGHVLEQVRGAAPVYNSRYPDDPDYEPSETEEAE